MWPWEHLAFGYLLYSILRRMAGAGPPRGPSALVLLIATQLPDLIDKPLGWVFHLAPTGRSIGHSLVIGGPVLTIVLGYSLLARRRSLGIAFAVGYLSHLAGDVLYDLLTEGRIAFRFLLWPVYAPSGSGPIDGVPYVLGLWGDFLAFLATPVGGLYLLMEVALLTLALVVWLRDGAPGIRPVSDVLDRRVPRR